MKQKELMTHLNEIGQKAAESIGYELVEVKIQRKQNPNIVLFVVFHPDGVKIDDCSVISKKIDEEMDAELFDQPYMLEVSSPGLDRPIKTQDDLRRNKGKLVEAHLYVQHEGQKEFHGYIESFDKDTVTLKMEDEESSVTLPLPSISLMRQLILF